MRRIFCLLSLVLLAVCPVLAEDQPAPATATPAAKQEPAPATAATPSEGQGKPAAAERKPPAAAGKPAPVTLTNPGFEEELKGWDNADQAELAGVFSLDGDNIHQGKRALHVQSQQAGQWPWVSQKVEGIEPRVSYAAGVWFRGSEESDSTAGLKLEFRDAKGEVTGSRYVRRPVPPGAWKQMAVEVRAPAGTATAVLYLRLIGDTEVWFDDVELFRNAAAPPVSAEPLRLALAPGAPRQVHLQVNCQSELPAAVEARLVLTDPLRKEVAGIKGQFARQDAHTLAGDFELPSLLPGLHTWRVKLPDGQAEGRFYVTLPLPKRQPKYLGEGGVLQIDGKAVFPIGIYHASVADYPLLAERGFTAVQGLASQDKAILTQALSQAKQSKLLVDVPLHYAGLVGANLNVSLAKLQAFTKDQQLSGWKIADEPDQHPETADEVPEAYARLKQKDDRRPLLLTVENPETYEYWANFCDALQVVCFPLPDRPLTVVSERVAKARRALQPWQHLSVLLQAGWLPEAVNQPTFAQARAMVYLALINGAQGIYWYSLRDPGWQLADSPLWERFRELNGEIALLARLVQGGQPVVIENSNPKLQAAVYGGAATQMMIVNPEPGEQTATIKLAHPAQKGEVLKGKAKVTIEDGTVVVTVPGGQAALVTLAGDVAPEPAETPKPDTAGKPGGPPPGAVKPGAGKPGTPQPDSAGATPKPATDQTEGEEQ